VYILAGSCLYVSTDVHFDAFGVLMMILNVTVATSERMLQRRLIVLEPVDISKTGLLVINNFIGSFYAAALLLPFPEYKTLWATFFDKRAEDYAILIFSCIAGMAIGWTAINAQAYVSATTMLVITNLNKAVVIVVGMVFMGETSTWQAILGCSIAISGGVFFAQHQEQLGERARASSKSKLLI
jgi:drug/metabolite transporter (DMT)-like permease